MLIRILLFLVEAAASLLSFAFLARFVLQWARASFRNPLGQFVIAITDWAVKPARRVIPGLWGLDLASLLLAWLVQGMYLGLAYGLLGGPLAPEAIAVVAVQALFALVRIGVWLAIAVVPPSSPGSTPTHPWPPSSMPSARPCWRPSAA
jgi:YggT family protein